VPHFKPVTNVPLDYMHLICLGIMRKLMYFWLDGELHNRLQHRAVEEISTYLVTQLKPSIPVEFARKPRALNSVKLWKATEYRMILLYTGPLAFQFVLKRKVYINFLTLHVIIRILSSQDLYEYLSYAQDLTFFYQNIYKTMEFRICHTTFIILYILLMMSKDLVHLINLALLNLKIICRH